MNHWEGICYADGSSGRHIFHRRRYGLFSSRCFSYKTREAFPTKYPVPFFHGKQGGHLPRNTRRSSSIETQTALEDQSVFFYKRPEGFIFDHQKKFSSRKFNNIFLTHKTRRTSFIEDHNIRTVLTSLFGIP